MKGLVSIIVPTYDRENLIGECLQSVIQQTYPHWELIIIDDGSTDNTKATVARFGDSRISYYLQPHQGILGKLRNDGVKKSNGEFIAFIDSDDRWATNKLSRQLELLSDDVNFCLTNGYHFGPNVTIQPPETDPVIKGNLFGKLMKEKELVMYMPSLLARRDVIDSVGAFDESLRSCTDVDFIYRLALKHNGVFTNERLVGIRKHAGMSSSLSEVTDQEYLLILEKFYNQRVLTKTEYNRILASYLYKKGLSQLRDKLPQQSLKNFSKYVALNPLDYRGWVRLLQSTVQQVV